MLMRTNVVWELLINSVFPPNCYGCGSFGVTFCAKCVGAMVPPKQICLGCGEHTSPPLGCLRCVDTKYGRVNAFWTYEGPAREAIKGFKYKGYLGAVLPLLYFLKPTQLARAKSLILSLRNPILISVPPHKHKVQEERGFDQTRIVAEILSLLLDTPLLPSGVLIRAKKSPSQVSASSKEERQKNVFGAFLLTQYSTLRDRSAVIVDDVLTTGATIRAIADLVFPHTKQKTSGIVLAHEDNGI